MQRWHVAENKANENIIKDNPDISPVVLRLLISRGLSAEQAKKFLEPDYAEHLHDPFLFKQMKEAVEVIFKHLQAGNKIVVYGDYDADGVCSTAIMHKTLNFLCNVVEMRHSLVSKIDIYIPDRASEGYGLKKSAIKNLAKAGAKLIITVDNATRNVAEVEYAKSLGLDIIITDHHEPGPQVPDCLIINPKVNGETYPFIGLAGCGVAFKVAEALLTSPLTPLLKKGEGNHSRATSPSHYQGEGRGDVFLKWLLDLAAIGTIADLVPLIDENRVLVKYGLVVLNKTKRLGLKKLIEVARSGVDKNGQNREIDSWQVGFQLAPRLNAAGRLGHANSAYELLVTEDEVEADKIAKQLNATNQERQRLTEEIFQYADAQINKDDKILFAVEPNLTPNPSPYKGEGKHSSRAMSPSPCQGDGQGEVWPAGVMGLVAGKLTEKYYRPALAITDKGGLASVPSGSGPRRSEEIVGSGRSIAEFDITAMLEECAEFLTNFGGHKQACGFTLKNRGMLEPFLAKAKEIAAKELKDAELAPTLEVDLEINFKDASEELFVALQALRPFGVGNPQPKFLTKNLLAVNVFNMGTDGQHLKLKLQDEHKILLDAVAFSASEEWKRIKVGDKIDLVYYIDMNEWNGKRNIQLKIVDLKIT